MLKTFSSHLSAQAYAKKKQKETSQPQEVVQIDTDVFAVIKTPEKEKDLPSIWQPVLRIIQAGGKLDRSALEKKTENLIRTLVLRKSERFAEIGREAKRMALLEQEKKAKDEKLKEQEYRLRVEANERKARNERAKELAEQAGQYKKMSLECLSNLWGSRNEELESDEIEVLRKIIRQKMNIEK